MITRRALTIGVAVLAMVAASGLPAAAQSADPKATDLKLEMKKKRTVVVPPAETAPAAGDAEAAARRLDAQRRAQELQRKAGPAPAPPLDETVVEGIHGKQLQEMPKR
jgi:hypothetical protein